MQASLFLEEMGSILLTPFVLYFSLPDCTHAILEFVRDNTVFVEGVGDICSLANFDFDKHGNSKYGAVTHCPKVCASPVAFSVSVRQSVAEVWVRKSFLQQEVMRLSVVEQRVGSVMSSSLS